MPTSTTRRPAPKLATSRSVEAATHAVAAARDALEVAETFLAWVQTADQVAGTAEREAREGKKPTVVYAQTDIKDFTGKARQTVQKAYAKGQYPPPDLMTPDGRPLWFPETLHTAGIVPDYALPATPDAEPEAEPDAEEATS